MLYIIVSLFLIQVEDTTNEVDQLLTYVNTVFPHTTGISIIVDDSQSGHTTLLQIVEKCSEYGRETLGQYIVKNTLTEESILLLNFHKSHVLFTDIDEINMKKVLNMTNQMGLISFKDSLRLFMTERSMKGIQEICYKPKYHYYYTDNIKSSSNATSIIEIVEKCGKASNEVEKSTCFKRFVHFSGHKAIVS